MKHTLFVGRMGWLLAWVLLLPLCLQAQSPNSGSLNGKIIEVLNADILTFQKTGARSAQKLIGNVRLLHDSTYFYCDSAYLYDFDNSFEAFSHIKADMPDGSVMTCKRMTYSGNTKILKAFDNIELEDGDATLRTNRLIYYRDKNYGYYSGGGELQDNKNLLTSEKGFYYPDEDMAYFKGRVELVNEDYTLSTDTLGYNTQTETARFMTYTRIKSDDSEIITYDGEYDTRNDAIRLFDQAQVKDDEYELKGDSLFYDNARNVGIAQGNVTLDETEGDMTVSGGYAEFDRKNHSSFVTRNAVATQSFDDDTLYILADTLFSFEDTVADTRTFIAYHNVIVYMNDMQGRADSLVYHYNDSIIELFNSPILWSDESQLTGDTIRIWMRNKEVDSMSVKYNGFLVSQEDTVGFNQVKGKRLEAKFEDSQIRWMHVIGNSENIYFTKDEEDKYQGMNQAQSQEMIVYLKDNKTEKVVFLKQPEGVYKPFHEIVFQTNELDGMKWRVDERPEKPSF